MNWSGVEPSHQHFLKDPQVTVVHSQAENTHLMSSPYDQGQWWSVASTWWPSWSGAALPARNLGGQFLSSGCFLSCRGFLANILLGTLPWFLPYPYVIGTISNKQTNKNNLFTSTHSLNVNCFEKETLWHCSKWQFSLTCSKWKVTAEYMQRKGSGVVTL